MEIGIATAWGNATECTDFENIKLTPKPWAKYNWFKIIFWWNQNSTKETKVNLHNGQFVQKLILEKDAVVVLQTTKPCWLYCMDFVALGFIWKNLSFATL